MRNEWFFLFVEVGSNTKSSSSDAQKVSLIGRCRKNKFNWDCGCDYFLKYFLFINILK
jgi:hypothetical protein